MQHSTNQGGIRDYVAPADPPVEPSEPADPVVSEPVVSKPVVSEPPPPAGALSLREALARRAAAAAEERSADEVIDATAGEPGTGAPAEHTSPVAGQATISSDYVEADITGDTARRWSPMRVRVPVPEVVSPPTRRILIAVGTALALLVLVAIVTVAATHHPTSKLPTFGSTASSADACNVVTQAEATAAFGDNAGIPHLVLGSCVYDDGTHELIVAVSRQGAVAQYDSLRPATAQDIPGIGDRAFYGNGRLGVLKGSSFMLLVVSPYSTTAPNPNLVLLARSAVTRL